MSYLPLSPSMLRGEAFTRYAVLPRRVEFDGVPILTGLTRNDDVSFDFDDDKPGIPTSVSLWYNGCDYIVYSWFLLYFEINHFISFLHDRVNH